MLITMLQEPTVIWVATMEQMAQKNEDIDELLFQNIGTARPANKLYSALSRDSRLHWQDEDVRQGVTTCLFLLWNIWKQTIL